MKRMILAAWAGLALAGAASAQEPVLTWNYDGFNGNAATAWAVKTPAANGKLPEFMIAQDDRTPGKLQIQVATLEIDCAKRTVRPITLDTYDASFVKTGSRTSKGGHTPFMGALEYSLSGACASRSAATRQANAADALKWIYTYHPVAEVGPQPPTGSNLTFELAGISSQRQDNWLETTTITRDGKFAKAWVLEVWQAGWQLSGGRQMEKPAAWRLYEFECAGVLRQRNPAWIEYDAKFAVANTKTVSAEFKVLSSQPDKQIAKRICNNRPMLFSGNFKGSDKELVASWYGASSFVGVAAKPVEAPRYTAVDLGPTIRFTILDGSFKYTGAFTREGASSYLYKGEFHPDTAPNAPIKDTLEVLGIRNGLLYLNSNFRDSPYAIPVANGKVTGKGILYSERGDDDFSWSLVEPVTIAMKSAPTPSPVPAPAAFQLPAIVKFREATTKPGDGVYEAVWTRRGASNIYDGAWTYLPTGQKFSDVMEVRGVEAGKLIIYRQGIKGTYTIPITDGKPARGTASWVSDPAFYVEFVLN